MLHDAATKESKDFPRKVNRSRGDNRLKLLVDDLVEYVLKLDELKLMDSLPVFVARSLARVPIVAIEDIEVFIMAQKLEKVESRLLKLEQSEKVSFSGVNNIMPINASSSVSSDVASQSTSRPSNSSALVVGQNSNGEGDNSTNGWSTVAGKLKHSLDNFSTSRAKKIVGSNISIAGNSKIKPVKSLIRKFIFHVDNVLPDTSVDDITSYLKDNNVNTVSCFSAKSWIHFNRNDNDSDDDSLSKCNAFRVCVNLEDRNTVVNADFWPAGVLVREWKFKK
jgi:hypothetical protein